VDVVPSNVSQVPPPVTAPDGPPLAGATRVPEPVSLIFRVLGFRALANATPPALTVGGVVKKLRLTMSQRTCAALTDALWSAENAVAPRAAIGSLSVLTHESARPPSTTPNTPAADVLIAPPPRVNHDELTERHDVRPG